ncbi:MAG: TetR/AcrR family transcriptional regulator [bacterium]|nr:TetR/AcrR family transcriptional regulator [bacterium]
MRSKGEITREKIISEAVGLFHKKGFGATSVSDLIQAAKIKKGSLYFHFAGKDDVVYAVLAQAGENFMKFLDSSLTGKTPGDCLENFFKNVLERHRSSGFVGGCIFGNTALEASDTCERHAAFVDLIFDEWTEKIRKKVEEAQKNVEVTKEIASDALACHIVSVIEGGIMLSRLKKKEQPLRDCLDSLRVFLKLKK